MTTTKTALKAPDAMKFASDRDNDQQLVAQLAAGESVAAIVSNDPAERASRLNAVLALAASAGIAMYRVSNGLRGPLTLPRIAFQLAHRNELDGGSRSAPMSRPHVRRVLVIEQAETLAAEALSAMRGIAEVQLLLVGSSALRPMLGMLGDEPHLSTLSVPAVASRDEEEFERIDDPAWSLDWEDDPLEEHTSSTGAPDVGRLRPMPVLRAAPRLVPQPLENRPRAVIAPLCLATAAIIAAVVAVITLQTSASVMPSPPTASEPATPMASVESPATEPAAIPSAPNAAQPDRSIFPSHLPSVSAPSPRLSVLAATDPAKPIAAAVSARPSQSGSAPAAGETPLVATSALPLREQFETFLQLPENRGRHFTSGERRALFSQFSTWQGQHAPDSMPSPGLGQAPRIVLHVPRDLSGDRPQRVDHVTDILGQLGTVQTRIVDEQPSRPSVRYFYDADAAMARQVATALDRTDPGWQPRDFTSYRPKPVAGTIEVWLPRR